MKFARTALTALGSLVLAVMLAGVFIPKAGHAMSTLLVDVVNTPNVNVVNTPSVNVTGTSNVNVESLPVVQLSGTSSVSVVNGTTSPVPTLGTEALNSFVAEGGCNLTGSYSCTTSIYTVPTGKVAVIESVSGLCNLDSGTALYLAYLSSGTSVVVISTPSPPIATIGGGVSVSFGQNLKTYISGPASPLVLNYYTNATQSGIVNSCRGIVSGYLVPAS
jgi:hypothetical protein